MNVTIEEISSIKRKVTVELPEQKAVETRKKHLDDYVRKARLKGFRPGKAPRNLVSKIYADDLHHQVLEELVQECIPGILEEHDLKPMGLPMLETVDYKEGQPYIFTVMVELKPEFETPPWQGLELEKVSVEITDELVDKKIEELRLSMSTISKIEEDRPVIQGDVAEITYLGYKDEKAIEGMGPGPFKVELGRDQMLPGFTENLLGMKVGEEKDIIVTLPRTLEDAELAGKEVSLHTTLLAIHLREMPELDDELAKDLGVEGVDTLESLKERIRQDLLKENDHRADDAFNRQLTVILSNMIKIELPSVMVEREIQNKVQAMQQEFNKNGIDFSKMGIDLNMLSQRFRADAEKSVTAALVLDQIGRDNQVEITTEDIDKEIEEMSQEYGQTPEMLRSYYEGRDLINNLKEGLRAAKTLDIIKAQAKIILVDKINPEKMGMPSPPPKPESGGGNQGPEEENQGPEGENQNPEGENTTSPETE